MKEWPINRCNVTSRVIKSRESDGYSINPILWWINQQNTKPPSASGTVASSRSSNCLVQAGIDWVECNAMRLESRWNEHTWKGGLNGTFETGRWPLGGEHGVNMVWNYEFFFLVRILSKSCLNAPELWLSRDKTWLSQCHEWPAPQINTWLPNEPKNHPFRTTYLIIAWPFFYLPRLPSHPLTFSVCIRTNVHVQV